jgi:VWFA-related protein
MIARGTAAGTLDPERSASAFRSICEALKMPAHSAHVLAILHEIAGGSADLDEAVPDRLLRLRGERRAAFDRVKGLQNAPPIGALHGQDDAAKSAAALSGMIYAASLDPEGLLVNEDPHLLKKHRFFPAAPKDKQPALFTPSVLNSSSDSAGSYFSGGFTNFEEAARTLASGGKFRGPAAPARVIPAESAIGSADPIETGSSPTEAVFRTNGRLVELYATITDSHGRYAEELTRDRFQILDRGVAQKIVAFESELSESSCVLLLDTTGSMLRALPALKNAALKLIENLRPSDSVAVYSFSESLTELQPFTTDKKAAKRAVLRTHAHGNTALYDALTRVNRDLSGRSGKKAIVVFTDGDDNASTLTSETAIRRAKAAGVPIYTIAQGEALTHPAFLNQLTGISKATGGVSFAIREPREIRSVFERVSQDLTHGYLFAFQPAPAQDHEWHSIEVVVKSKNVKVRAREGYYPE